MIDVDDIYGNTDWMNEWCDVIDVDGDGDGDFYVQSLFLNLLLNGSLDGN
jgi:hypothetical protein